ncbi:MAG: tetratricopeptide repeat protein [Candidatus Rokubacteria bacterium]|nr:tetratricopeptide repeat protein [Candidatus Rokubacteria bacterium]
MIGRLAGLVTLVLAFGVAALPAPAAAQLTEADVFVAEGILALEDKKYEAALAHFKRALDQEPDHIEALYYSGVALMAQDKPAPAVGILERARQKSPADASVGFQLGLGYFALQQYDRAEPLLEEIFAREPTLNSLGYYVGYMRYRNGNHQAALRAFRAGRTDDPNIAQLTRFYSGLALAALGLPAQAAAEVEQALRLQPASPLTGPAERLRESFVQARAAERRFRADVRIGGTYDDNVTARPDARPGDATIHALRHPRHETTGELFSMRLEYDWLKQGPWTASAGYSFFTTYNNSTPGFNLQDHLGTFGVTRQNVLGSMPLITGAQYAYEFVVLDDDELLQRHALSLSSTLVESPRHLTSVLLKFEVKEYSETRPLAIAEFQDAKNYLIGFLHLIRFSEDRHFLKFGYQFDLDDTLGRNLTYDGHRFLAGAQYTLPWQNIRLSYDFGLHYRDYRNRHTVYPEDDPGTKERQDHEYSHGLRIELPLPGNFTLGADYQGTSVRSNLRPFTYRRDVYSLSLSWSY